MYSDPSVYRFSYNFLIDLFYSLFASISYLLRVLFCLITFTELHATPISFTLLYPWFSANFWYSRCLLLLADRRTPPTYYLLTLDPGKVEIVTTTTSSKLHRDSSETPTAYIGMSSALICVLLLTGKEILDRRFVVTAGPCAG